MAKKISSSKKILIASLLVGVLVLGAIVSLVLILAAPQQNVRTSVNVSYILYLMFNKNLTFWQNIY